MADEIRVTREGGAATPASTPVRPAASDPARTTPAEAAARVPAYEDPERARADIEATRARMSDTIDEIEGVLVRKKEQIQNRLDITAPVRENPWPSMGAALGAGLFLGLLTGGGEDDHEDYDDYDVYDVEPPARAWSRPARHLGSREDVLEERTRRLLSIAREQEAEIQRLRGTRPGGRREPITSRISHAVKDEYEHRSERVAHAAHDSHSSFDDLGEMLADGVRSFVGDALRQLVRGR